MAFQDFILHIIAGSMSLMLSIITVLLSAMFNGRIGKSKGHMELLSLHKYFGIALGISVILTFIFMILPPIYAGEPIILGIHGWFAFTALVIAISEVLMRFIVKDKSKIRKIHLYLGYLLLIILSFQIVFGMYLVAT
ncbi:MAG TPA: hypothetical protein VMV49_10270 [Candidatus Deferrimicrobium sp.]|nr:hypothetical protein [Candidatus Deferrimicrobium sp.]